MGTRRHRLFRKMNPGEDLRLLLPIWALFTAYGVLAAACDPPEEDPGAFVPPPPAAPFLSRKATTPDEAIEYYQTIGVLDANDPTQPGPKGTLDQWKEANGFSAGGDVTATYFNEFDLRFGREMHCTSVSTRVACYVTNYGTDPQGQPGPGGSATVALQDAVARTNPVATVAMEYDPSAGDASVQFFTYEGAGNSVTEAALDSQGAKLVPGLCLSCHGGNYDAGANVVRNGNFLPFDVFSFRYADGVPGFSQREQEDAFRRLNELVLLTQPAQAIRDLIKGMYPGGVSNPGIAASSSYVPPGWEVRDDPVTAPHENNDALLLYTFVVRPYCRTCHVAAATPERPELDFTTYEHFRGLVGRINAQVCFAHQMPHAEVTWLKFWRERPIIAHGALADYLYIPADQRGDCGRDRAA